jgi:hypothetical protein
MDSASTAQLGQHDAYHEQWLAHPEQFVITNMDPMQDSNLLIPTIVLHTKLAVLSNVEMVRIFINRYSN